MNKDLEIFENRNDDWLALERKYEQTVSAWDFDEAKKIKIDHEENCEANEIKRNHEIRHKAYNNNFKNVDNLIDQRKILLIFILCFLIIPMIIFVMIIESNGNIGEYAYMIPIISLIIIVNILKKKEKNK